MPANIRIAGTGAITYVSGSSIEIAVSAPMPGSTPIRLPSSTPNTDHIRWLGISATPKPYHRSCSACPTVSAPGEKREGHLQSEDEDDDARDRDAGRKQERAADAVALVAHRGYEHREECRRDETALAAQDDEGEDAAEHAQPAPPLGRRRLLVAEIARLCGQPDRQAGERQQGAEDDRDEAGAHTREGAHAIA